MRFLRTLLTPFVFLGCLGISLAAAWEVWRTGVPDEDAAGRAARERELATREVSGMVGTLAESFLARWQPTEAQYEFVDRLDFYLRRGAMVQARPSDFSWRERRRLRENAERVAQIWLRSRANRYHRLPPREQRQFVSEQILALQSWAPLAAVAFGFEPRELVTFYELERRQETLRIVGRRDSRVEDALAARDSLLAWIETIDDEGQRQRVLHFLQVLQEQFASPLQS